MSCARATASICRGFRWTTRRRSSSSRQARQRGSSSSSRAECSSSSRIFGPTASRTSSPPWRSIAPARSAAGWSKTSSTASTDARRSRSLHPLVDDVLAPTYGVIVYQEQVMQIAQKLAGYTLGGADLLRRAMGKKKPEEMAKQKSYLPRGGEQERRRRGGRRAHLRSARVLRGLRLQQEPLGGLRAHHLPNGVAEGALPGRAALRDPDERQGPDRQGRPHDRRRASDGGDGPPARRQRERHRLQGRLHASARRQADAARASKVEDPLRPADPVRARRRARPRRVGARGGLRGARAGGPFRDLFDLAARVDAKTRQQGVFEALVQCGAFDTTLAEAGDLARARVRVDRRRARAFARGEPRPRRRPDELFGLFDAATPRHRRRRLAGRRLRGVRRRGTGARRSCASGSRSGSTSPGHPARALPQGRRRARAARAAPCRRVRADGRLGASSAWPGWSRGTARRSSRTAAARSRSSSSRT